MTRACSYRGLVGPSSVSCIVSWSSRGAKRIKSAGTFRAFGVRRFAEQSAHEIGRVLCAELLHDVRAVKFDSPGADAERPRGLLAGSPPHDLSQRHAFPRRQRLMTCKW